MVLPHVALYWLRYSLPVFLWFFLMLPWIDCDIVFSVFSWFFVMLLLIYCDIVYHCSRGSSSCCIGLIVTLCICVLMVLKHISLDWLWHCLSVFSWFCLMLHSIDFDIVYLCSYGSSLCCIGLIVTLFICVLMVLLHVALNWLWYCYSVFSWFFLMLPWIDCDIVFFCVFMVHRHDAFDFLWHCLSLFFSVFSWFCLICIGLIVTLFVCVLMVLPHVALDWLWHFYLCSYDSSSYCHGLIVTLFIYVLMVLLHVALDWLWHCLSVFSWFFLMLHWIDCDIVYLCSYGSSSCCIGLIVTLFICVLTVLPHVALDWFWHCLSVFLWFFLMLHCIDFDIVYLCSYGSSLCCIWLIVTLFICVLMVLPHVAWDWFWHCLSVFSWFFLMLHMIDVTVFICVLMGLPYFAFDWLRHCLMVLPHVTLDWLWHC